MIVSRSRYIGQLNRSRGIRLIKIVTGMRRSGKSFLLKKLFRQHLQDDGVQNDHILVIDMENRKNQAFKDPNYLNKGSERIYIQSVWRMPDAEKMEQEKHSLRMVDDSFRKMLIVGERTKPWSDESGIQIMSIYDFLLDLSSTEKW